MHRYRQKSRHRRPSYLLCPSNFLIITPKNVFCGATCPLRTGMVPPSRKKLWLKQIFGRPSESNALLRQVLAGVNRNRRDSPFSLSPVSHPRRKIEPLLRSLLLLPDPPCFPYFNSDASPVERIAEASMRSSPTPSRKERSRPAAVSPTFHRRSSKAPCACAVLLWRGEDWWSPRPMAENLTARTRWGEKPTWMRRQSGWRGGERGAGLARNPLLL